MQSGREAAAAPTSSVLPHDPGWRPGATAKLPEGGRTGGGAGPAPASVGLTVATVPVAVPPPLTEPRGVVGIENVILDVLSR